MAHEKMYEGSKEFDHRSKSIFFGTREDVLNNFSLHTRICKEKVNYSETKLSRRKSLALTMPGDRCGTWAGEPAARQLSRVRAWKGDSPHDHEIAMPTRRAAILLRSRLCSADRQASFSSTRDETEPPASSIGSSIWGKENNEGARVGGGASPPGIYSRARLPRARAGRGLLLPRPLSSPFLPCPPGRPAISGSIRLLVRPVARRLLETRVRGSYHKALAITSRDARGRHGTARCGANCALPAQLALGARRVFVAASTRAT
jgi:hypothetical protein